MCHVINIYFSFYSTRSVIYTSDTAFIWIQQQWLLTCCLEKVHSHLLHNPTVVQPHPHGFHGKPTGNHKQARCLSFNSSCMIKTCCDTSRKIHLVHDGSLGQHALSNSSAPFLQLGAMVLENIYFPPTSQNKTIPLALLCAQYSRLRYDHRFMKKQRLALEKPVWREKTRLTRTEVQAVATSKAWHNSGRASFSTPRSRRRQKEQGLKKSNPVVWDKQIFFQGK